MKNTIVGLRWTADLNAPANAKYDSWISLDNRWARVYEPCQSKMRLLDFVGFRWTVDLTGPAQAK